MKRAAIATALVVAVASTAFAYVRSRTEKGVAVFWPGSCTFVQPDSAGTPDLPADQVFATIQKSMQNWTDAVGSQAYLKLMYDQPAPLEAHLDGVNIVKFRTDKWCHPNDTQQNNVCYSSSAAGITTVFFVQDGSDKAGTILDADIELNDINFTFAILPTTDQPRAGTSLANLENTLTHELGHLQGLDHTCKDSATPPQEVDENGNPPPDCATLSTLPTAEQAKIRTATMYNFAMPGETNKRSPEADDVAGIANAYPPASDPGTCKHTNLDDYKSHGCAIGGPAAPSGAALAMLLVALVALRLPPSLALTLHSPPRLARRRTVKKTATALLGTFVSLAIAGCGGGGGTVVGPSSPPPVQDNFFATWEIQSGTHGALGCEEVGAAAVDMDIVNVDTGSRFVDSFDCHDYQGTSGLVDVGRFDVLLNLTDASGGVLSQIDVGTENVSTAGTIDLGHFIFTLP